MIQHDFVFEAWMSEAEGWMAGRLPGNALRDHLDYDLAWPGLRWGLSGLGVEVNDVLESEAHFLDDR